MSRYIDADALMKSFCINKDGRRIPEVDCDNISVTVPIKDIKRIIREQPTAYDVDAVVAELQNGQMWKEFMIYDLTHREREIIGKAIEIVRKGGAQ